MLAFVTEFMQRSEAIHIGNIISNKHGGFERILLNDLAERRALGYQCGGSKFHNHLARCAAQTVCFGQWLHNWKKQEFHLGRIFDITKMNGAAQAFVLPNQPGHIGLASKLGLRLIQHFCDGINGSKPCGMISQRTALAPFQPVIANNDELTDINAAGDIADGTSSDDAGVIHLARNSGDGIHHTWIRDRGVWYRRNLAQNPIEIGKEPRWAMPQHFQNPACDRSFRHFTSF